MTTEYRYTLLKWKRRVGEGVVEEWQIDGSADVTDAIETIPPDRHRNILVPLRLVGTKLMDAMWKAHMRPDLDGFWYREEVSDVD